ncbi:MAG: adenylate cyclase [Campylobacterota bacterium]|nr:adenylate cyclase [Campylobacterota bacterium]
MKRWKIQLLVGFAIAFLMSVLYVFLPSQFQSIDNRLRDYMFLLRGPIPTSGDVVIVDIDEKSLKELGQWPWQRKKFAQVLQNLATAEAGVIGLDIVFAERDNSNPAKILGELGYPLEGVEDYDLILAQTIANTPTVPGYVFKMENDGIPSESTPMIPAIFIEKNKPENEYILEPYRAILNIPIIQENAYSSGFFNTIPDDDSGIIRSVPLVMKHDGVVYPSLSMEMIRILTEANKVYVNYAEDIGVENIQSGELTVPTDRYGRLLVNYRGPSFTFPYISALDVYSGTFDPAMIAGKFVLVGTSAAGLLDLRAMPFDNVYPGVEIHANVIDNILTGDFISKPSWIVAADIAMMFFVGITLAIILGYTSAFMSLLVAAVYVSALFAFNYYMLFYEGLTFNILFVIALLSTTVYMLSMVLSYFLETKQKNMIKGKFASKVSPAVMEDILKNPDSNVLSGTEREITISFSDVRNFTNISEAMGNPKSLIEFMNEYMDPMTEIIIQSGGTVDKFIGDAIMSYWNAPNDVEDHADKAVVATLKQLHALKALNAKLREDPRFINVVKMSDAANKPIIDIGIGLNTGVAIVGEMGSTGRSDYTCIGDPINLGSRLESLCKYYNSKCNISNFTKAQLKGTYIYRFLDLVTVKGKKEPIEIWQIHDFDEDMPPEETLYKVPRAKLDEELALYHHAIELYKGAKFEEALKIFKEMNESKDKTNNAIYDIYIERCEHYIEVPPKDFNGVFVHTTKG